MAQVAIKTSKVEMGLQIPIKGNDEVSEVSRALKSVDTCMCTVLNTTTDPVFMISLEGVVHSVNPATYILLGYEEKDIVGKSILSFISELHFSDRESSSNIHLQYADGVTLKGKKIPLEISSIYMEYDNTIYIVCVIRDLTTISQLQYELEAVFNLSPDGFLVQRKDRTISYVNLAFCSMFSLKPDWLKDHDWKNFTDLIDKSIDHEQHPDIKLLDQLFTENILYLKLPVERILRVSRQKIDKMDVDSSDILFFVDITHETIMDKMKSEFLTTAAHELRTPLSGVMGFSELLSIRDYSSEQTKEIAGNINRQTIRLKNLLDDLLDIASIENRTIGMLELVQDTIEAPLVELCKDTSGSDNFHFIDFKKPEYWPIIEFDQSKIRQILTNILNNAYKYSPNSPKIKISTTMRITEKISEFGVIVEDYGIGMTPEQLSHVGERFYRADTSGNISGTGLGISLVKELIDMHKGRLEIESTIRVGTIVTLWLPTL